MPTWKQNGIKRSSQTPIQSADWWRWHSQKRNHNKEAASCSWFPKICCQQETSQGRLQLENFLMTSSCFLISHPRCIMLREKNLKTISSRLLWYQSFSHFPYAILKPILQNAAGYIGRTWTIEKVKMERASKQSGSCIELNCEWSNRIFSILPSLWSWTKLTCRGANHTQTMQRMQEAYAIAMQNMKKSARRGQKNYSQRAWSSTLQPGDLVRNLTPRGPGKLHSYWEDVIHVIGGLRGPDSPVYVVEPLLATERRQVLHRNLFLPCPYLVKQPEVCRHEKRKIVKSKRDQ